MPVNLLEVPDFWHAVVRGLGITIALTVITMILGLVLGTLVALARLYAPAPLRWFAAGYVFVFRGVPLLILLFFAYYALPRIPGIRSTLLWDWVLVSPFATAVLAMTLNNAGYLAEIVRGGILTVPKGLVEAGRGVGMPPSTIFRRIVGPIAFRNMLASLGNETIAVIKASAITSVITIRDLLGGPSVVGKIYLDQFTPLFVAAVGYFLLVQAVEIAVARLTARFGIEGRAGPLNQTSLSEVQA
jgi:His/Glu/Gln/Arg/opine family amino acid ABC transporter permease subunit